MTPWTAARQASLSFTISQSSLRLMSIGSAMPSDRLILCRPLLLPPVIVSSAPRCVLRRWIPEVGDPCSRRLSLDVPSSLMSFPSPLCLLGQQPVHGALCAGEPEISSPLCCYPLSTLRHDCTSPRLSPNWPELICGRSKILPSYPLKALPEAGSTLLRLFPQIAYKQCCCLQSPGHH